MKSCPNCGADGAHEREHHDDGKSRIIGQQWFYRCGSWRAETPEGFKTAHLSAECKVRTAEVARSIAEVEFANHLTGCHRDREGLIGTIRQLQHEAKQAAERFDEQLARAAAIYDEAKAAHAIERAEIIDDVRNAEANAEQWKRRAAANYAEGMAAVNGRQAIVNDLIRIRDTVDKWTGNSRGEGLEWALNGVRSIINQQAMPPGIGEDTAQVWSSQPSGAPRRGPYVYDLTFETIDLLRSEGHGHVMALHDGYHVTVANSDEGDALRVTVYPGNAAREQDWRHWPISLGSIPTDRRDFAAAKTAALDALRRAGSQSPESAQAQTRREPMTTKETIAKVIGILQMIAMITPIKFDDTALEFVIWASEKPWFVALVERILPASTADELEAQSLTFEPELVTGLLEFSKETGRPVSGRAGKLLALITQVIAIAKAVKPLFGT
jgi:hypothetical protein